MITSMTKYSFILLNGQQEGFLEKLQEIGLVDITRSVKPVDKTSSELLSEVEKRQGLISALGRLELPEGMQERPLKGDLTQATEEALSRLTELEGQLKSAMKAEAEAAPWGNYSTEVLRKLADAGCPIRFHIVSAKTFDPAWEASHALQVISESDGKVRFVVAGEDGLPGEVPAPKLSTPETKKALEDLQEQIDSLKGTLLSARTRQGELEAANREMLADLDRYLATVAAVPAAENTLVTLVGYAPEENDAAVSAALDETGVFYLKEAARAEDNPPIKLKNNWFVRQFEVLTDMYGRPDYNEFDPTPYISFFFLLFFAMCMGDAGYGLLLVIGGLLLRKVDSFKDMAPLITILGVGTFLVGIVMHTFFGVDIAALPWIPGWLKAVMITGTIAGFEAQMVLALVIGVIHLCLAMVVKTVYATRNNGFLESLGTWGWTLLIVGGVIVGALALFSLVPPAVTKWIIIVLGILSALGIFLFNDIHRNPLKNIGSGLWETYNTVTGLLGDVLSYLRLYALGLAGGMLGKAFNDIATMTLGDGGLTIGWIPFIIILVIGHALNLAMCCLGAFVHPLRLNFLEFFKNSGYDGKGRTYRPVKK